MTERLPTGDLADMLTLNAALIRFKDQTMIARAHPLSHRLDEPFALLRCRG